MIPDHRPRCDDCDNRIGTKDDHESGCFWDDLDGFEVEQNQRVRSVDAQIEEAFRRQRER